MKNNLETFPNIRVVWNLTNSCPFNCPMCVASANTRRENNIDKGKILQSLLSVPKEKLTIDFSGGDPLFLPENIEIVKKASSILGKDNISISSTGLSIAKLSDEDLISLSSSYDMTYDFPKKYVQYDIRDKRYNPINFEQCKRLIKLGLSVDIFVPIRDISFTYYDELAKDLCEINPESINLLKCMPLNERFDTQNIDSIKFADYLTATLRKYGYSKKIGINCALQEDYKCEKNCNMLTEKKIGLDQFGDLYTCIWASDILTDKTNNPFYLGNVLDNTLLEILNSEKTKAFKNNLDDNRNTCHVLNYYYQKHKQR